jgi:hypothetical protein
MPDGPFVVGKEGVAQHSDDKRVYFNVNAPVAPFGSMAERTLIDARFSQSPTPFPTKSRQHWAIPALPPG